MLKKFFTLSGSSLFAQLVSFLTIPIISRLVTPEEFGAFYFFSSFAGLLGGLVTGKVEQLFFSVSETKAAWLIAVAYKFVISSVLLILVFVFLIDVLGEGLSIGWLLLPLGIFATATITPSYFFLLKVSDIASLSYSRIILAFLQSGMQLAFCLMSPSFVSLLLGLYVSQLGVAIFLAWRVRVRVKMLNYVSDRDVELDYRIMAHSIGFQSLSTLNTSFIPSFFTIFGYIDLTGVVAAVHRLFMMPVNLFGSALSHVVLGEYNNNPKKTLHLINIVLLVVVLISATAFFLSNLWGATVVWFLGEQWIGAAEIAKYILPLYGLIFVSLIVNQACIAVRKQYLLSRLELIKLLSVTIVFAVAEGMGILDIVPIFSSTASFITFICIVVAIFSLRGGISRQYP